MRNSVRGWRFLLLLVFMAAFLFACSKEKPIENLNDDTSVTELPVENTAAEDTDQEDSDAGKPNEEAIIESDNDLVDITTKEAKEITPEVAEELKEIRDISSSELVKEIRIGWNLGNTMDATDGGSTINAETSWGNPRTTREMITVIKDAGFNTLRVPTSWGNHFGEGPEYKIDKAWLDRVQAIVDYGIDQDMYVILNMHHEEWHFPSYDNLEEAKGILTKVWSQIAERFQSYGEHLIFEGMNEPRMKGTNFEWNGGNEEGRDVVNQLNAAFVETIRTSGGNNPLRHLMIPTYAASSDPKTWTDFEIPKDDKIIVSIHAYTPYHFALNKNGTPNWSLDVENDTKEIDNLMNNLYNNFISKGQPVILGEFGAMNKSDNLEARVAWSEYYIKKATEKGIPCIWWDNGAFNGTGELFGLLNRRALTWQYPEVVDALMKGLR